MKKRKKSHRLTITIKRPPASKYFGEEDAPEIIDAQWELKEPEEETKMWLEYLIMDKAFALLLAGKVHSLSEIRHLIGTHKFNKEELIQAYTNLVGEVRNAANTRLEKLEPAIQNALEPASTLYISSCCTTCQFYKRVAPSQGFCTFGKDPENEVQQNLNSPYAKLEEMEKQINSHKNLYPVVHGLACCDNYSKTSDKSRLRHLAKLIKSVQNEIIFEADLE